VACLVVYKIRPVKKGLLFKAAFFYARRKLQGLF
jgi:hypothetical protein